ncbi:MAG: hypothetical protein IT304_08705 [Dehalococcoidia bacterium]|nr:hypothetical protein [Dehalococcoidia bacterium]
MIEQFIAYAREAELEANAEVINQRREWHQLQAIERLELALNRARTRLARAANRVAVTG